MLNKRYIDGNFCTGMGVGAKRVVHCVSLRAQFARSGILKKWNDHLLPEEVINGGLITVRETEPFICHSIV